MDFWATLGIEATDDPRAIKRAYAKRLKTCRPDEDPEAFQRLSDAYEAALRFAKGRMPRRVMTSGPAPLDPPRDLPRSSRLETVAPDVQPEENPPAPKTDEGPTLAGELRALSRSVFDVLDESGETAAITRFEEIVSRDEFFEIERKTVLEDCFLEHAASGRGPEFPGRLMKHLAEHYHWSSPQYLRRHPWLAGFLDRVESNVLYQTLRSGEYARQWGRGWLHEMRLGMACRSLLGPCRPWVFRIQIFAWRIHAVIREMLGSFDRVLIANELDTDTVRWWLKAAGRYHFTWWHFSIALILAAIIVPDDALWSLDGFGPVALTGIWIGGIAAASLVVYAVGYIFYLRHRFVVPKARLFKDTSGFFVLMLSLPVLTMLSSQFLPVVSFVPPLIFMVVVLLMFGFRMLLLFYFSVGVAVAAFAMVATVLGVSGTASTETDDQLAMVAIFAGWLSYTVWCTAPRPSAAWLDRYLYGGKDPMLGLGLVNLIAILICVLGLKVIGL